MSVPLILRYVNLDFVAPARRINITNPNKFIMRANVKNKRLLSI